MIIFNLDGTLADFSHRKHFLKLPNISPKWKEFYEACDADKPIESAIKTLCALEGYDYNIMIWSGRCESVRSKTEYWINSHIEATCWNCAKLKMRSIGDDTRWDILKERWADEVMESGETIDFVFDSDSSMWKRKGVFVFKNFSSTNCNAKGI